MALGFALALQSRAAVAQTAEPPLELRLDGQVVRGFAAAAPDARERVALRLPGRGTKLIMQGPLAVVAIEGGQVAVLDRRTAKDARILSEVSVGSTVTEMEILGQVLWVVTVDGKRTSIPLGPVLAKVETEPHAQQVLQCQPDEVRAGEVRLSIHGDLLHVSSQPKGGSRSCAVTKLPDVGSSAVLRDSAAYVPLRNRGLAIVDVSAPTAPRYDRAEEINRRIVSIRLVDGVLWTIDATSQIVTFDQQQLRPSVPINRQTSEPSPPSSPIQNPASSSPQVPPVPGTQQASEPSPPSSPIQDPAPSSSQFPQRPKIAFQTNQTQYTLQGQTLARRAKGAEDSVAAETLTLPGRGTSLLVYGPLVLVALEPVGLMIVESRPDGPMKIVGRHSSLAVAYMYIVRDALEITTAQDSKFSMSMKKLLCQYNLYRADAEPDKEQTRDGIAAAGQRIEPEVLEDRLLLKREEAGTLRSCASVVLPSTGRTAITTPEAAYVTLTKGGIGVVDIKDPSKPRFVETAGAGRQLFAPALVQGSLHLKDQGENDYRFSLLDPLHPKLMQFVSATKDDSANVSFAASVSAGFLYTYGLSRSSFLGSFDFKAGWRFYSKMEIGFGPRIAIGKTAAGNTILIGNPVSFSIGAWWSRRIYSGFLFGILDFIYINSTTRSFAWVSIPLTLDVRCMLAQLKQGALIVMAQPSWSGTLIETFNAEGTRTYGLSSRFMLNLGLGWSY